jgi:HAD superfamily hydrolase (TIGR01509 family)
MKAIIFDCDGVLVNTEILSARAYRDVYARHGLTITPDMFLRMIGLKQADILKQLRGIEGGLLPPEGDAELTEMVLGLIRDEVAATEGLVDFVHGLQVPFCVASSSDVPRIRLSLETAEVIGWFEGRIFSSTMVSRGKPAPDLFLLAARQLGVAPGDCVVFEDSVAGITAAVAAGMTGIGYIGGGHLPPEQAERLRAAGASAVIGHWREAPGVFGN